MKLQNLFFSMAKFNVASKRMYELYRCILNCLKGDMFNDRLPDGYFQNGLSDLETIHFDFLSEYMSVMIFHRPAVTKTS